MHTNKYRAMGGPYREQVSIELSSIHSHGQRYQFKGVSHIGKVHVWGRGVHAWLTCGSQRKPKMAALRCLLHFVRVWVPYVPENSTSKPGPLAR